MYLKRLC